MRQPEDTKTMELLDAPKRGRGRPSKPDALTPAQRAKLYRDRKRQAASNNGDVTENTKSLDVTDNEDAEFWRGMYEAQLQRTVELEQRIAAGKSFSYAKVTEITEKAILFLLDSCGDDGDRALLQRKAWAYGAWSLWSEVVDGFRHTDDSRRIRGLFDDGYA